jgi:hypothetical protein
MGNAKNIPIDYKSFLVKRTLKILRNFGGIVFDKDIFQCSPYRDHFALALKGQLSIATDNPELMKAIKELQKEISLLGLTPKEIERLGLDQFQSTTA